MSQYHTPVMLDESISALITNPDGAYVDATFGGGGHSRAILSRLGPDGRLIAFDRDSDALANRPDDRRLSLIHNNFRFIENFILLEGLSGALDGILADLGVSSHQFDTAERGFSFRFDAPLDMRMGAEAQTSAEEIVNSYGEDALRDLLKTCGEVDNAGRIASMIVSARAKGRITTTTQLNAAVEKAIPKAAAHKYLAKIYQALRIEVNGELRALGKFLEGSARILKPGGRLVIITYHSLEDRMVKNFIRSGDIHGIMQEDLHGNVIRPLEAATPKLVLPAEEEIAANTRARSAKMRIAVKKEPES